MTSRVLVDAHAGWPIKVIMHTLDKDGHTSYVDVRIVEAFNKETFYVWDNRKVEIIEMKDRVEKETINMPIISLNSNNELEIL